MGKRHTGRKIAVQALYQTELRKQSVGEFSDKFLKSIALTDETKEWANLLIHGTWDHLLECDDLIKKYAVGWEFGRINSLDKSILRVAFYELLHSDTPPMIVIDEAIEIAKKYSTEESPKFINGILGQYIKECSPDSSKPSGK